MIVCRECGSENADNTALCANCGKTLSVGGSQAPPPPPAQPQYAQPQHNPYQQYRPNPAYPQYQQQPQSGGLGIGALVCGIIAICTFWLIPLIGIVLGIVAIALGAVGMGRKERYAVAGLVLGLVALILSILLIIIAILYVLSTGLI